MSKGIETLVSRLVAELEDVIRDAVMVNIKGALRGSSNGASKVHRTSAPKQARRVPTRNHVASDKRSPKQMETMRARLLAFAARTPGQRSEDIQKAMKLGPLDIALPLKQLLAAKLLRAEGAARGRRYWAASA